MQLTIQMKKNEIRVRDNYQSEGFGLAVRNYRTRSPTLRTKNEQRWKVLKPPALLITFILFELIIVTTCIFTYSSLFILT